MSINTEQSHWTHFIACLPSRGSGQLETGWVCVVVDVLLSVSDAQSEIWTRRYTSECREQCAEHTRTHSRHYYYYFFLSHPVLTAFHLPCLIIARQQTTPSSKSATITMRTTRYMGGQRCRCQSSPSNTTQGRSPTRYQLVLPLLLVFLTDVSSIFFGIRHLL